jgi:glycosyltransferase involved in cell wall biosynthesis
LSKKSGNLLFIKHKNFNAQTVGNDIRILSEKFEVTVQNVYAPNNILIVLGLFRQFLYLFFFGYRYQLFYIWFCDYHSFLPVLIARLYRIKTIVNVGGYDATDIPEIRCGAFNKTGLRNKVRAFSLELTYKYCSFIITVDDSLIKNVNSYIFSDINGREVHDGIMNFMPDLITPIRTVYTCYDVDFFHADDSVKKERLVLSVGLTPNDNEFKRKGFDVLTKAAEIMNDIQFVLIGISQEQQEKIINSGLRNIKGYRKVPRFELRKLFQKAKVFAQFSLFEGLPNTLCEAMLCECIPVGSDVNGIPVAMGGLGFIVKKKDINLIVDAISKAMKSTQEDGKKARDYILNNFSFERRRKDIYQIINGLLDK